MELHISGQDYLKAIYILQMNKGLVRSVDVTKSMKQHLGHPVFCYVLREVLRQIVGAHVLSRLVHENIAVVRIVIATAANLLV